MLKIYAIKTHGCDRHEVGRTLLRWKYEELWGNTLPEITVTENGKPQFADGSGFFSLSYTGEFCCCALCDDPVGLDVEMIRSPAGYCYVVFPEDAHLPDCHIDQPMDFLKYVIKIEL